MSNAPLTPVDDPEPTAPVIDYSLAAVPYNEAYENDLMKAILYPSSKTPAQPPSNPPPHIAPTSLPVPLDSPLRTYPSAVPGIFLTHENGHFTGGPGLTPAAKAEYSKRFIAEHNIKTAEELERVRAQLIAQKIEEAKARARAREAAIRKNAEIDKRIQELEVQRSAEMRVAERVKQDKQRRRHAAMQEKKKQQEQAQKQETAPTVSRWDLAHPVTRAETTSSRWDLAYPITRAKKNDYA